MYLIFFTNNKIYEQFERIPLENLAPKKKLPRYGGRVAKCLPEIF